MSKDEAGTDHHPPHSVAAVHAAGDLASGEEAVNAGLAPRGNHNAAVGDLDMRSNSIDRFAVPRTPHFDEILPTLSQVVQQGLVKGAVFLEVADRDVGAPG